MKYFKLIQRLNNLKNYKDRNDHHPEENVLSHSLQAYKIAKKESRNPVLYVAALFHDIGKQIETLGHDKISVDILKSFGYNNINVFWLIENHIRIIWFLDGSMKRYEKVQQLAHGAYFNELAHLRRIDNMARKPGFDFYISSEMTIEINNILEKTNEN